DSAGALMGEAKLPIDQSAATSGGWVADTNGVGETILTKDSWKTIIKFVGGKDATGTVWADDFMLVGRAGGWAGQNWNTSVDMPTGWNYWLPPVGGNDGELSKGYENTRVTDEEAYSGTHSLKFDLPFTREQGDAWIGTRRYLLNNDAPLLSMQGSKDISSLTNINPGDSLRISVMVKASNLVPDSAALYPGTWSVGFTPIFHSGYLNNDPYDEIGAHDLTFAFPNVTSFDWTKYHVDIAVPDNEAAIALSVRLHVYSRFTGTIFFDDVTVEKIYSSIGVKDGDNSVPTEFKLANNYPNPFNPSTRINYSVPKAANVSIAVYNILGKRIATLTNRPHNPGNYSVTWNGTNDEGLKVSSGIYFYTLTSDNSVSIIKKMILMK
ncbi:MAG TPA: T9SS type A sorting domain-containing protein, partial [Ignavibacteriales bacterium]|nr:T9SS type A sorting domain-containing protein [Ignavibacteriales bacterium]